MAFARPDGTGSSGHGSKRTTNDGRRLGVVRLGVVLAVGAAAVLGTLGLVDALRAFDARADQYGRLSKKDLAYGYQQSPTLWPPRDVLDHAVAAMPDDARYSVAFGPAWRLGRTRWTNDLTEGFLRFFLLPRIESHSGEWVFCFACDESRLDGELRVMFESADGLRFGRIER